MYCSGDIWETAQRAKVRADSEHVLVFASELGSHAIGLTSDQSRMSFPSTAVP